MFLIRGFGGFNKDCKILEVKYWFKFLKSNGVFFFFNILVLENSKFKVVGKNQTRAK